MKHKRLTAGVTELLFEIKLLGESPLNVGMDIVPDPTNAGTIYVSLEPGVTTATGAPLPATDIVTYPPEDVAKTGATLYYIASQAAQAFTIFVD